MPATSIPKIKSSGNSTPTPQSSSSSPRPSVPQKENQTPQDVEDEYVEEQDGSSEEGEGQEGPRGPHFDTIDTFFYMSIAVLGDVFDGIWVTRIFFAPVTLLFLYVKGVDQMISKNMLSQGIEMIPVLGWLPISTTMAVFTIVMTNHPEFMEKLGPAGEALEKVGEMSKKKKL